MGMVHIFRKLHYVEFFIIPEDWIEKALGCYANFFFLFRDFGGGWPRDIYNETTAFIWVWYKEQADRVD